MAPVTYLEKLLDGQLEIDGRRPPTTTLEGWRSYVAEEPLDFQLLPEDAWKNLTDRERSRYDEARETYHSELIVVETQIVTNVVKQGRLLVRVNKREQSARRGLIVNGPWATGKSTAIKQLGLTHEYLVRSRFPGDDRIPVVYVTAPPKGSSKKLATMLAHFLGLPAFGPRANETDIAVTVCDVLNAAKTDLVIIDEIHNMNLTTTAGEDMSDSLKYLTENLAATFVYAGINVESEGLFTGVRGQQIMARCVMERTAKIPYGTEWRTIVKTMESALRLHHHEPESLLRQARYLHQRTGGLISSLSHLIRAAAIMAVDDGSEKVTRELMNTIKIDRYSEAATKAEEAG